MALSEFNSRRVISIKFKVLLRNFGSRKFNALRIKSKLNSNKCVLIIVFSTESLIKIKVILYPKNCLIFILVTRHCLTSKVLPLAALRVPQHKQLTDFCLTPRLSSISRHR